MVSVHCESNWLSTLCAETVSKVLFANNSFQLSNSVLLVTCHSVCVLNSLSAFNIQHRSYSDGSMSVSELLEWFRYTVKITGFLLCLLSLCQQGVVCQQQFASSFSNLTSPPEYVCAYQTLLILRGSVHHKHCQEQLSCSLPNLASPPTCHYVCALNSSSVLNIYCQSYSGGSMSV